MLSLDASLRVLALQAAREPDWEAFFRRVARWFSTTFHTPLHQVFDLPEAFVLQHYYEAAFENLEEQEWQQELRDALETPEERHVRLTAEAKEDKFLLAKATEDRIRLEKKRAQTPGLGEDGEAIRKDLETATDRLKAALKDLPGNIQPAKQPGERVLKTQPDTGSTLEFKMGEGLENRPLGLPEPPPMKKRTRRTPGQS